MKKRILSLTLTFTLIIAIVPISAISFSAGSGSIGNIRMISLGKDFSAAVTVSGDLYTWGMNDRGQLGLGDKGNRNTPRKVSGISNVISVSLGDSFGAAVTASGDVYTWGDNYNGQLGLGDEGFGSERTTPTKVPGLTNVVDISLGAGHCAAITANGDLYTWGSRMGLGLGGNYDRTSPTKVPGLSNVATVSLGLNRSAAITVDGDLYTWGHAYNGALGLGIDRNITIETPTKVPGLSNVNAVSMGRQHCAAITANGDLYTWGDNSSFMLGLGDRTNRTTPTRVPGLSNVVAIGLEESHSAAITANGDLYIWGSNNANQLGLGVVDTDGRYYHIQETPTKVPGLPNAVSVCLGPKHSAAITANGDLYIWGAGSSGQLGLGDNTSRNSPTIVTVINSNTVTPATPHSQFSGDMGKAGGFPTFSMGGAHSAAISSNGDLYTWGWNNDGQLGHGDKELRRSLSKVPGLSNVIAVSMGGFYELDYSGHITSLTVTPLGIAHSAAITANGDLYTWGNNTSGQLGHGDNSTRTTPAKVTVLPNVAAVSLGGAHSAAITANGDLYTWGNNDFGQLGLGDDVNRTRPTKTQGLSGVVAVCLGETHSAAITANGDLFTWGDNNYGELGLGDNTSRRTPTKIPGLSNVIAISMGAFNSAAITANGDLYTWGANRDGLLGHGDASDRSIPTNVTGLSNVAAVGLGDERSAAITATGEMYFWGDRANQLPTKIEWLTNATAVSFGSRHIAVLSANGDLFTWGDSYYGQTGREPTDGGDFVLSAFTPYYNAPNRTMGSVKLPGSTAPVSALSVNSPSSWAAEYVDAAIASGLVPQHLQSRYTQTATRADFCALAVSMYEAVTGNEIEGRMTFNDTNDENVLKMGALGVVSGVGNGRFDPNGALTREQAAAMLARLAEVIGKPLNKSSPTFADNHQISTWAVEAVGQIQAAGIMGGTGDNMFSPKSPYTREQSIITVLRLYNMVT